jgi:hypothetical protein
MGNLRYICCQPANSYYTWQIEVLINNFIKMGVNGNHMDIVCGIDDDIVPTEWRKLQQGYPYIRFFFYNDTRVDKSYIPSIYFNLMKQHIVARPEIQDDVLFMHDCDIILTKPPKFDIMIGDNSWYLSDTNSYINYDYIIGKGDGIYKKMCDIIGIDPLIPKLMNSNSGGAQYIVKNTTYKFWDKVEKDSVELYKMFTEAEKSWDKDFYPIQKWTSGMWSFLWNAWYFGNETIVDKRLNFTWSTNQIKDIDEVSILHNAGVTCACDGLFFKGNYTNKLPYNENLEIDKNRASYYYWQEICETAEKSFLL